MILFLLYSRLHSFSLSQQDSSVWCEVLIVVTLKINRLLGCNAMKLCRYEQLRRFRGKYNPENGIRTDLVYFVSYMPEYWLQNPVFLLSNLGAFCLPTCLTVLDFIPALLIDECISVYFQTLE